MVFKAKIFVKTLLSAKSTEFHSLRNMKKRNFSKTSIILGSLSKRQHMGREILPGRSGQQTKKLILDQYEYKIQLSQRLFSPCKIIENFDTIFSKLFLKNHLHHQFQHRFYCIIFVIIIHLLKYFFNFDWKSLIHPKCLPFKKPAMVSFILHYKNWLYQVPPHTYNRIAMVQKDLLAKRQRCQICYLVFSLKLLIKFVSSYIVNISNFCTIQKANKLFWLVK